LLTNGDKPVFLRLEYLHRQFGMELIESILINHYQLFRKHAELNLILKDRVCPMIIKNMASKSGFPLTIRLFRVISILIKHFSDIFMIESDLFMSMFGEILRSDSALWQKVVVLEIFRSICSDGELCR
jgi:hypothetical protein